MHDLKKTSRHAHVKNLHAIQCMIYLNVYFIHMQKIDAKNIQKFHKQI